MALRSENFLLRRYVEKAMVDLPALPTVVMQVIEATERDTVTTSQIETLISSDPAITTKLLKVVNSAYFGLPRQISNIGQAIAILGMHQVRNLVMSIGVLNALHSSSPRVADAQRRFWQLSFAAASCAQTVADKKGLGKKDQEQIFIGGLLHDIGRLFLVTLFNLPYQEVVKSAKASGEPLGTVEERILGTTHAELGGVLAEKWNFPIALVDMIRYHDGGVDLHAPSCVTCVHIADRIASSLYDLDGVHAEVDIAPSALEWLAWAEEDVEALRLQVQTDVERASELLGVL